MSSSHPLLDLQDFLTLSLRFGSSNEIHGEAPAARSSEALRNSEGLLIRAAELQEREELEIHLLERMHVTLSQDIAKTWLLAMQLEL